MAYYLDRMASFLKFSRKFPVITDAFVRLGAAYVEDDKRNRLQGDILTCAGEESHQLSLRDAISLHNVISAEVGFSANASESVALSENGPGPLELQCHAVPRAKGKTPTPKRSR